MSDSPLMFVLELLHRVCLAFASQPIRMSSSLLPSVNSLSDSGGTSLSCATKKLLFFCSTLTFAVSAVL